MRIKYPDKFYIKEYDSKFLWRYIDFYKLIDLLINKRIYFTRFDNFEDGIEGLTGRGVGLKVLTQSEPLTKNNINDFEKETKEKHINDDRNRRKEYLNTLANSQQTQFASCWFLGERESLAMWKLYSGNGGVAIKFNAKELIEAIIAAAKSYTNSPFEIFYFGSVNYKNIWPFDPYETFDGKFNGLKKDKSYIYENEFRFVATVLSKNKGNYKSFVLPIGELSAYNMTIITNPFMENWKIENLRSLLKKYNLENYLTISSMEINN